MTPRILVVDDERAIQLALRGLLRREGYDVELAGSGEEAIERLREAGFFLPDIHETSTLMWDMRYAGPREAVFHAIVRKNLGCSHHMFGRDHAGVGNYYDTYAAHKVFENLPDLGIKSVLTLEWWYCPVCQGVTYEGFCGHRDQKQDLAGTVIRED